MAKIDLNAIKAEASQEPHEVTLGDKTFTIPPIGSWPSHLLDLIVEGDLRNALAEVMGDDEFDAMEECGLSIGDYARMFKEMSAHEGLGELGNSPRSGRSSKTTRPRSKRTSRATTASH